MLFALQVSLYDVAQTVDAMQAGFDAALETAVQQVTAAAGAATTSYVDTSVHLLEGKLDVAMAGYALCHTIGDGPTTSFQLSHTPLMPSYGLSLT